MTSVVYHSNYSKDSFWLLKYFFSYDLIYVQPPNPSHPLKYRILTKITLEKVQGNKPDKFRLFLLPVKFFSLFTRDKFMSRVRFEERLDSRKNDKNSKFLLFEVVNTRHSYQTFFIHSTTLKSLMNVISSVIQRRNSRVGYQ